MLSRYTTCINSFCQCTAWHSHVHRPIEKSKKLFVFEGLALAHLFTNVYQADDYDYYHHFASGRR
jgi:hypothetical protein